MVVELVAEEHAAGRGGLGPDLHAAQVHGQGGGGGLASNGGPGPVVRGKVHSHGLGVPAKERVQDPIGQLAPGQAVPRPKKQAPVAATAYTAT